MRVEYDEDTGDRAYLAWKECGYNAAEAARRLAAEGLVLHKSTILAWRDRGGWNMRVLKERGEEKPVKRDSAGLTAGLEAQMRRYEGFFETLGADAINVQATHAYTSVVKAIADVHKKTELDLYAMSPVVMGAFVKFVSAERKSLGKPFVDTLFGLIDRFFDDVKPQ